MSEEDEEKTSFYTDQGTYCYTKIPTQLGRNLEAYVDDMVIKSKTEQEMVMDIAETFDNLRKINMKLNPKKCSFGVKEGKFLGSAERSMPFFKILKNIMKENKDDYRWMEDAERAFQEMKKLIIEILTLTTPISKETLYVYLATSQEAGLADSINETSVGAKHLEICSLTSEEANLEEWTLYTDGASSLKGVGAGLVLIDPTGVEYTYAIRLNFPSTNNEAKYEALLSLSKMMRPDTLTDALPKYLGSTKPTRAHLSALCQVNAYDVIIRNQEEAFHTLKSFRSPMTATQRVVDEVVSYVFRIKRPFKRGEFIVLIIACMLKVVVTGDFNEVRFTSERLGSTFHASNAAEFNMFITNSYFIDVPLGGIQKKSIMEHDRRALQDYLLEIDSCLDKREGLPDDLPNYAKTFSRYWRYRLFSAPDWSRVPIKGIFTRRLGADSSHYLEGDISLDEIKKAVWDCRFDKSPNELISHEQSSYIKGRRSLDGPLILNKIVFWCKSRKEQALLFKVDFQKAFDLVRWDHLDDILGKFSFSSKWRGWIRGCLHSSKASVLVNGSPTDVFLFHRGLRQGDPLSPFLFILVMESLHVKFQRVIDRCMFVPILVGKMICLKVNVHKSSLYGLGVHSSDIQSMANSFGYLANNHPFTYLSVKVAANMACINSWNEVIQKVPIKLSNGKLNPYRWEVSGLTSSNLFRVLMALLISLPGHVPVTLSGS
ncbi:RNA-directed DNA polymerase, eukaryota, reverse transcriptase zinc-binding domain protein [Tanacetum coccineum]